MCLSHVARDNMAATLQTFQLHLLRWNLFGQLSNYTEICSHGSNCSFTASLKFLLWSLSYRCQKLLILARKLSWHWNVLWLDSPFTLICHSHISYLLHCKDSDVQIFMFAKNVNVHSISTPESWWRHQMEIFSALLALCAEIHRWPVNPLTKASDAELWYFPWSVPK